MSKSSGGVKETSQERALAGVATQSFARQKALYDPLMGKYFKSANDGTTPTDQIKGAANVSTEAAFAPAARSGIGSALRTGGNVADSIASTGLAKTESRGLGQANALSAGKDVQLGRLSQLIGFGRGQATQATTGIGGSAKAAQNEAELDAQIKENQRSQLLSTGASAAGLAYGLKGPANPTSGAPGAPVTSGTFGYSYTPSTFT